MSTFNSTNSLFLYAQKLAAQIGGQLCNIGRPNYDQADNTPIIIHTNIRFKVEKATRSILSQPAYFGSEFYAVFGKRSLLIAGDLIIPVGEQHSDTPIMTVMSYSPIEECIAFRSDATATIINGDIGTVFSNVNYSALGQGYPGAEFNRELESSLQIPTKRFICFARDLAQNTSTSVRDVEGLIFIENNSEMRRWEISQAEAAGNIMVLTCKQAKIQ